MNSFVISGIPWFSSELYILESLYWEQYSPFHLTTHTSVLEMISNLTNSLSSIMMLIFIPTILCKSLCVRPAEPSSLYDTSPNGADISKLVKKVSTDITSEFMIEILSSEAGHSALLCEQAEWDRMSKNYHMCVHQVQHQLKCGGHGGVCQWVQAFVDSCTMRVMGQCWTLALKTSQAPQPTQARIHPAAAPPGSPAGPFYAWAQTGATLTRTTSFTPPTMQRNRGAYLKIYMQPEQT